MGNWEQGLRAGHQGGDLMRNQRQGTQEGLKDQLRKTVAQGLFLQVMENQGKF